ncbi:MAG: C40 family peptidase [Chitinophagaceae bacterium]|nr:C40 family peptidase [Chitinophagaceae bacterium]
MKHLFFVSVALGIFSGTSITGNAQTTVNLMRLNDGVQSGSISNNSEVNSSKAETVYLKPAMAVTTRGKNAEGMTIEQCSALQFKYAQLLNTEVETVSNYSLYQFIDEWWATRYRYGGRTREGIDCSAFAGTLLNTVYGINTPRTAREQYATCERLEREQLKEGDLVFFNTRGGISHVGVYLGNGFFTHASVGQRGHHQQPG